MLVFSTVLLYQKEQSFQRNCIFSSSQFTHLYTLPRGRKTAAFFKDLKPFISCLHLSQQSSSPWPEYCWVFEEQSRHRKTGVYSCADCLLVPLCTTDRKKTVKTACAISLMCAVFHNRILVCFASQKEKVLDKDLVGGSFMSCSLLEVRSLP